MRSIVAISMVSMFLLTVAAVAMPQLEASPIEGEAQNIVLNDLSNITNDANNTQVLVAPTPIAVAGIPVTQEEPKVEEGVFMTFTSSSYSLDAINKALADCPVGQSVKLDAGTYILNGIVNVPNGKTLKGSLGADGEIATEITTSLTGGALKNRGYINIGSGGNNISDIRTVNGYYFFGLDSHDFVFYNCEYNGPSDPAAGQFNLCGFNIYIGKNGNYDNGRFVDCVAKNAPAFGFLVMADTTKNSNRLGPNSYSAHGWSWEGCEAYNCGIANINYPSRFIYGCGFDLFEGFGVNDPVVGLRLTDCVSNGNAADGFHIEYSMSVIDCVFTRCTANDNGHWFKAGNTKNPFDGVLIGTGFYLGGKDTAQTKVIDCLALGNWGYSNQGGGHGIVDSLRKTDSDGTYRLGLGALL